MAAHLANPSAKLWRPPPAVLRWLTPRDAVDLDLAVLVACPECRAREFLSPHQLLEMSDRNAPATLAEPAAPCPRCNGPAALYAFSTPAERFEALKRADRRARLAERKKDRLAFATLTLLAIVIGYRLLEILAPSSPLSGDLHGALHHMLDPLRAAIMSFLGAHPDATGASHVPEMALFLGLTFASYLQRGKTLRIVARAQAALMSAAKAITPADSGRAALDAVGGAILTFGPPLLGVVTVGVVFQNLMIVTASAFAVFFTPNLDLARDRAAIESEDAQFASFILDCVAPFAFLYGVMIAAVASVIVALAGL